MIKRSFAGLLAGVCVISSAAAVPFTSANAEGTAGYTMKVSVDLAGEKTSISPYIYGVNAFDSSSLKNVTVNNVRQGGNRFTGYNWETNWSNAGEDWHHSSDTNQGDIGDGPAYAVRNFSQFSGKKNIPYKLATLQMAGYVSADKDGSVKADEVAPSNRWNKVEFRKDGELSLEPDLTDGTVYMDEYVNYIVNKLGDASSKTGIQGYSLDNEPVLWNDTHPLLHPEEVTSKELISKSIELAKVVKEIDPKAEVFGPAFWGMLPCMNCGDGSDIKDSSGQVTGKFTDEEWSAVKSNYFWYLDYYLEQMAKAEQENGKRLLDVVDVHYYAQDCSTDAARLQAARSLYDPDYEENSWLMPWAKQYFPFLSNLKKSVDKYYPGTKIAVSEYNVANIGDEKNTGKSVVSAIAETECLGAFAMNNVYFATYWGTLSACPYVESAINLYTNYDGKGSSFGDTLVSAKTEDLSKAAAFASINGDDDTKVTMVLSNKDTANAENAEITLEGTSTNYKSAVVYAVTQDHSDIRVIDVKNDLSGNKLTVELPPLSVAQIVLSDKETDAELYKEPDITVTEEKFVFSELEMSPNKVPMIPIKDAKTLKKVIINATSSSNSGSAWYCGGGGLCFNQLVSGGKLVGWGSKSFSYSGGTQDIVVEMDGTFTIPDPDKPNSNLEIEGTYNDTYIEFQDWWKSSANSEKGEDVSVTYNTITMVYEKDNSGTEPSSETVSESSSTASEVDPDAKYGDANCDGQINIADAVLVMQVATNPDKYAQGKSEVSITARGEKNADVDGKAGLTNADALLIQKFKLGLVEKLPV